MGSFLFLISRHLNTEQEGIKARKRVFQKAKGRLWGWGGMENVLYDEWHHRFCCGCHGAQLLSWLICKVELTNKDVFNAPSLLLSAESCFMPEVTQTTPSLITFSMQELELPKQRSCVPDPSDLHFRWSRLSWAILEPDESQEAAGNELRLKESFWDFRKMKKENSCARTGLDTAQDFHERLYNYHFYFSSC